MKDDETEIPDLFDIHQSGDMILIEYYLIHHPLIVTDLIKKCKDEGILEDLIEMYPIIQKSNTNLNIEKETNSTF